LEFCENLQDGVFIALMFCGDFGKFHRVASAIVIIRELSRQSNARQLFRLSFADCARIRFLVTVVQQNHLHAPQL
jgi:hypothetical protein